MTTESLKNLYPAARLDAVREATARSGLDALLLTPGPDLRYVTGYDALPLERLTCLVVPAADDPFLVVPRLEAPAARHSPAGDLGIEIAGWDETDDPFSLITARIGAARRVGLADRMWAMQSLRFAEVLPSAKLELAGTVLGPLRSRKSPAELDALREAGAAIDAVHAQVPDLLRAGRTEKEVAREIGDAILNAGHSTVDFVIVGSGPNAASPHHEPGGRVIEPGDVVVVDIGGQMPSGYCSDSTRTYAVGHAPAEFLDYYAVLQRAQDAGVAAAKAGARCEAVDIAARDVITEAGYGAEFIHRTGHGIGIETHEEPYIVKGNAEVLEPGMAFSVEPGIYFADRHGARIEDIVLCTEAGPERVNNRPRELIIIDG